MLTKLENNELIGYLETFGVIAFAKNIVLALLVLLIGLWIIRIILKGLRKRLMGQKVDPSLRSFLMPLVSISLKLVLFIMVIRQLGIEATSLLALITSAGLAVGLALQGSLSNFAGGVLILFTKPFKVDDFIEAKGYSGTVVDISLFYTTLKTPNGQKVVIPNSELSNASMMNYSSYPTRRLDLTFSCSYEEDFEAVKATLLEVISSNEHVLSDPEPQVLLAEFGPNTIQFKVRGWVKRENYWNAYWPIMNDVKVAFNRKQFKIPYQQMVVHIQKEDQKDTK